jgi:hypothetical protein
MRTIADEGYAPRLRVSDEEKIDVLLQMAAELWLQQHPHELDYWSEDDPPAKAVRLIPPTFRRRFLVWAEHAYDVEWVRRATEGTADE